MFYRYTNIESVYRRIRRQIQFFNKKYAANWLSNFVTLEELGKTPVPAGFGESGSYTDNQFYVK